MKLWQLDCHSELFTVTWPSQAGFTFSIAVQKPSKLSHFSSFWSFLLWTAFTSCLSFPGSDLKPSCLLTAFSQQNTSWKEVSPNHRGLWGCWRFLSSILFGYLVSHRLTVWLLKSKSISDASGPTVKGQEQSFFLICRSGKIFNSHQTELLNQNNTYTNTQKKNQIKPKHQPTKEPKKPSSCLLAINTF